MRASATGARGARRRTRRRRRSARSRCARLPSSPARRISSSCSARCCATSAPGSWRVSGASLTEAWMRTRRAPRAASRSSSRAPGRDGEIELMAAIERRLERIAEDVFAGRCGVAAREGDAPDDAAACASAAEECAAALTDALRPRENVDALVTPRVLGFAQRVAYASEMSRRKSGTIPGDVPGRWCRSPWRCARRSRRTPRAGPGRRRRRAGARRLRPRRVRLRGRRAHRAGAPPLRAEPAAASAAEQVDARNRRAAARLRREMAEASPKRCARAARPRGGGVGGGPRRAAPRGGGGDSAGPPL